MNNSINNENIIKVIESIELNPLLSLEENYTKSIKEFENNNFQIYKPESLNDMICAKDFSKIFNVYQNDIKNTIFVFNEHLNDEKISLVLNSFSPPHEKSQVYFISSYPLPDILRFLQKNNSNSFFEYESIKALKNISELQNDISLINGYYESSINLINKFFNLSLSNNIPHDIKSLESLIIDKFRDGNQYDTIYDTDIDYFPHYSLVLIGLYLSQVLIHNFKGELFFDSQKDIKELGIGFSVKDNEIIDIMANPINKIFNFYLYGKDSSIINWFYEIKYYLNNPDKISSDN